MSFLPARHYHEKDASSLSASFSRYFKYRWRVAKPTQLLLDEAPQSIMEDGPAGDSVLVEEIQSHRLLLAAESNELCVRPESIDVVDLMHTVAGMYRHDVASGGEISVLHSASGKAVVTDRDASFTRAGEYGKECTSEGM